eukprot:7631591-Heterocapsa_arctica.AAC.1
MKYRWTLQQFLDHCRKVAEFSLSEHGVRALRDGQAALEEEAEPLSQASERLDLSLSLIPGFLEGP